MLQTQLYIWYEFPKYENTDEPRWGSVREKFCEIGPKDLSQQCGLFIMVLSNWKDFLHPTEKNDFQRSPLANQVSTLSTEEYNRLYSELISVLNKNLNSTIRPINILIDIVSVFWKSSINILEYLYITLLYTDEFFKDSTALNALAYTERTFDIPQGKFLKEWEYLKHSGLKKINGDPWENLRKYADEFL